MQLKIESSNQLGLIWKIYESMRHKKTNWMVCFLFWRMRHFLDEIEFFLKLTPIFYTNGRIRKKNHYERQIKNQCRIRQKLTPAVFRRFLPDIGSLVFMSYVPIDREMFALSRKIKYSFVKCRELKLQTVYWRGIFFRQN